MRHRLEMESPAVNYGHRPPYSHTNDATASTSKGAAPQLGQTWGHETISSQLLQTSFFFLTRLLYRSQSKGRNRPNLDDG